MSSIEYVEITIPLYYRLFKDSRRTHQVKAATD